ncbi:MAG: NAD(P)(+) transhydrogenase (Re/Si-specific) subunit beta, partial [Sphingomicrobium sp.]
MHEAAATPAWVLLAYLISGVCFIVALRGLSSPESSRRGNRAGMIGMAIAVVTTLITHVPAERVRKIGDVDVSNIGFLILRVDRLTLTEIAAAILIGGAIGLITARKIQMTAMPQLVAAFHSLVGMAAVLVGAAAYLNPEAFDIAVRVTPIATPSIISIYPASRVEMGLGVAIGAITFSGSVIAFLKLNGNMSGKPILLPARHVINFGTLFAIVALIGYFTQDQAPWVFFTVAGLSFAIGFLLIVPIGGADMPVVVSMLNSYSGWAAAAMGFTLHNTAMIITGALVGSSGAILSYIMCRAMNRSFISVIAGGFGAEAGAIADGTKTDRPWKRGSAEDAAFLLEQAESVIIVPGYGMAVAQAQHVLREMGDLLKKEGVSVKYAIHPV